MKEDDFGSDYFCSVYSSMLSSLDMFADDVLRLGGFDNLPENVKKELKDAYATANALLERLHDLAHEELNSSSNSESNSSMGQG